MDVSIEELYMLLGAKDVQIYKLQQEIRELREVKQTEAFVNAFQPPPVIEPAIIEPEK